MPKQASLLGSGVPLDGPLKGHDLQDLAPIAPGLARSFPFCLFEFELMNAPGSVGIQNSAPCISNFVLENVRDPRPLPGLPSGSYDRRHMKINRNDHRGSGPCQPPGNDLGRDILSDLAELEKEQYLDSRYSHRCFKGPLLLGLVMQGPLCFML